MFILDPILLVNTFMYMGSIYTGPGGGMAGFGVLMLTGATLVILFTIFIIQKLLNNYFLYRKAKPNQSLQSDAPEARR